MRYKYLAILINCFFSGTLWAQKDWKPVEGTLTTTWTSKVNPEKTLPEYPRPQMVRKEWKNLNGLWDYAVVPLLENKPATWQGKILVPFPVESNLSGVGKKSGPANRLWYKRNFTIPADWKDEKILLHFEAVDWETKVWVNGKLLGEHRGGYDDFSFDISSALNTSGTQEILLAVWDPSDSGFQPAGKQFNNPRSIWYTSSTGIWQTVWLEPVPEQHIDDFKLVPDIKKQQLHLYIPGGYDNSYLIEAIAYNNGIKAGTVRGRLNDTLHLQLDHVNYWSPSSPFLYDLEISLYHKNKKMDVVKSYFGMREIKLGKDEKGVVRLLLNNQPVFQLGPLDQGFWPDGLYTAPTDEALRYDIEIEKQLGYNMIRKHVKVESKRWYYWCDKLGMLVWQDMPSGDRHIRKEEPDIERTAQSAYQFKTELLEMIREHANHPSIVTWVPFNEGWGQFQTKEIVQLVRQADPTRLISATSGWADRTEGDMNDIHVYPGPAIPELETNRAAVLGEFGGQALVIKDHLWQMDLTRAPGHIRTSQTKEDLQTVYLGLINKLIDLKQKGLSAAVYTQITDVETEVNGIMTYDRKLIKFDIDQLKKIHQQLIGQ
ncbi:MAG: sugar-binding domain-containing protein [Chitinophagaceae bacterium]